MESYPCLRCVTRFQNKASLRHAGLRLSPQQSRARPVSIEGKAPFASEKEMA